MQISDWVGNAVLEAVAGAAEELAARLSGPDDPDARRATAAGVVSRRLFAAFLKRAGVDPADLAVAPLLAGPADSGRFRAPDGALGALDELIAGLPLRLREEGEAPGADGIGPELLAAAHERLRAGRHGDGVFYTPAGEVRFLCRTALHARLAAVAGLADDDPWLLGLIYGEEAGGRGQDAGGGWQGEGGRLQIARPANPQGGAGEGPGARLGRALLELRVCDPAAGSGALLVGMAIEMARLHGRLASPLSGEAEPAPVVRRCIVEHCLFGVDLDGEALQIARRRLFLFCLAAPASQADLRPAECADGPQPPAGRPGNLQSAICDLQSLHSHLRQGDGLADAGPAVRWQQEFPEVFGRPQPGFDVVVTNPPYVRQELLTPEYKAAAARVCQALLSARPPLDGKSDLYAYFTHLSLGLLRQGGTLSVISSNSWLDVGFGKALRALLLRESRVLLLVESASDTTFADAQVNPVIALLRRQAPDGSAVRFVRREGPLGEEIPAAEMAQILGASARASTSGGRVIPVSQAVLAGGDADGGWGGRYLRAPDLFHDLLERCPGRLCRLDALAGVRFGIKTGANDFFYLEDITGRAAAAEPAAHGVAAGGPLRLCRNGAGHLFALEERFLRPALRSPRELAGPVLRPDAVPALLFLCSEPRERLAGTAALRYIEWGETQGIQRRPSVAGRPQWWAVPLVPPPPVLHPLIVFERGCAAVNPDAVLCDANLVGITPEAEEHSVPLAACLASSLGMLMRELVGIANLGEGALKTNPAYLARMLVPDLRQCAASELARVRAAFDAVRGRPFPSLLKGDPEPGWQEVDAAVLALLGQGAPAAEDLRDAARRLVAGRLARARALPQAARRAWGTAAGRADSTSERACCTDG